MHVQSGSPHHIRWLAALAPIQATLPPDLSAEFPRSPGSEEAAPLPRYRAEADTLVLIAENEMNNRRLIEHILAAAGYGYVSASNGFEVLHILDTQSVDIILLDLSMPLLDGYQTIERIRRRPDGAALPIVAVTAHAMTEDRERALQSGCTDYLAKPFRASELLAVVRRLLSC